MYTFLPFGPFYIPRRLLGATNAYQTSTKSFFATRAHHGKDIRRSLPRVYCRFCGKAIRLSRAFIARKAANKPNEQVSVLELSSRLFLARCRSCHEEAYYTLSQVLEILDEDPGT